MSKVNKSNSLISVIIPALNEEGSIGHVIDDVGRVLSDERCKFEIIVVSGRSTDRTSAVAKQKGAIVIEDTNDLGKGYSIRKGLKICRGDIVVLMDGDGSHVPDEIPLMLKELDEGCDVVIPSRFLGGSDDMTPIVSIGNRLLTIIFNLLFPRRKFITDSLNGFKAFKREKFDNISFVSNGTEVEVEFLAKSLINGHRVVEIPGFERRRISGIAKGDSFHAGWKCLSICVSVFVYHLLTRLKSR